MTINRLITIFVLTLATISAIAGRKEETPVYAFGYATCLGDSTVYISAVTHLEGAHIAEKTKFLERREEYARQFEATLLSRFSKHFTCALFYEKSRKSAEAKLLKLRKSFKKQKDLRVEEIPAADFTFQPLAPIQ